MARENEGMSNNDLFFALLAVAGLMVSVVALAITIARRG